MWTSPLQKLGVWSRAWGGGAPHPKKMYLLLYFIITAPYTLRTCFWMPFAFICRFSNVIRYFFAHFFLPASLAGNVNIKQGVEGIQSTILMWVGRFLLISPSWRTELNLNSKSFMISSTNKVKKLVCKIWAVDFFFNSDEITVFFINLKILWNFQNSKILKSSFLHQASTK